MIFQAAMNAAGHDLILAGSDKATSQVQFSSRNTDFGTTTANNCSVTVSTPIVAPLGDINLGSITLGDPDGSNSADLQLLNSNVLDDTSSLKIYSGSTFDLNGVTDTVDHVDVYGTLVIGRGGNLTLSGNQGSKVEATGTLRVGPSADLSTDATPPTATLTENSGLTVFGKVILGSALTPAVLNMAGLLDLESGQVLATTGTKTVPDVVKIVSGVVQGKAISGSASILQCTVDLLGGFRAFSVPGANPLGTPDFELHGQIIDSTGSNGSGVGGIDKQGTGTMLAESTLANTYTGATTVELGMLQLNNTGTVTTPRTGKAVLGTVNIGSGAGILQFLADDQINKDVTVNISGQGQLDMNGHSQVLNTFAAAGGFVNLQFGGSLSFGQDNLDCSYSGTILGNGKLTKQGTGKFTFNGSTLSGSSAPFITAPATMVIETGLAVLASGRANGGAPMVLQIGTGLGAAAAAIVQLSSTNQLPDSGTVSVKKDGKLDLNGNPDTTGTLQIEGGLVDLGNVNLEVATLLALTGGTVKGSSGGNLILSNGVMVNPDPAASLIQVAVNLNRAPVTVNVASGGFQPALTIDGQIGDGSASTPGIFKTGFGDLAIVGTSAANDYSGVTTVDQGRLLLSHNGSFSIPGDLVIGNATDAAGAATIVSNYNGQTNPAKSLTVNASGVFDLQGRDTTFASLSGGGGTILLGTKTFTIGDSSNTIFAGNLSGTGAFVKVGSGQLALAGVNDITGTTTVQNGTLLVNGSLLNSVLTVSPGAVLGGTGSVGVVAAANATLQPGSPDGGTLQATSTLNLNNGTFNSIINDSKTQMSHRVAVNGNLNLTGSTLKLAFTDPLSSAYYLLASYGTLTGTFSTVSPALPSGYSLLYNFNNGTNDHNIALYKPIITLPVTHLSAGEATFNGVVTLSGNGTQAYFQYKLGASGNYVQAGTAISVTGSTASIPMTLRQASLTPDQVYYYRVVLETTGGTLYGTEQIFTTTAGPVVHTKQATKTLNTTATLNGNVEPANQKAYYIFQYGNTTNYELTPVTATPPLVGGPVPVDVFKAITGLTGGRTYHFRIVGSLNTNFNIPSDGSPATVYFGDDMTFVTPGPVATTLPATNVAALSATLNGSVNPGGKSTTVYLEYGLKVGSVVTYNLLTAKTTYTGNTLIPLPPTVIKALKFNADYAYRIVAVNADGTSKGDPMYFHTVTVVKPNITTQPVSKFVAAGTSVKLTTAVTEIVPTDSVPTYQWRKNKLAIAGATSATYTIPVVALTHAGAYDCVIKNAASINASAVIAAANTATTDTVQIGVVDTTPTTLNLKAGTAASMKANNAGAGLTFTWTQMNRTAISATHWSYKSTSNILATSVGQTLVAGDSPTGDSDKYTCTVTAPWMSAPNNTLQVIFTLHVFNQAPVITTTSLPDGIVSANYNGTGFQITVDPDSKKAPTSYSATGLPKGLIVNPTTGLITGKPVESSKFDGTNYTPFKVTLKVGNSIGSTSSLTPIEFIVRPLPAKVVGTFNGLVVRNASLGGNFGGKISVTITGVGPASGTMTGSLSLGAETASFTGKLDGTLTTSTATNLLAKRLGTLPPFIINLAFDGATGEMTGTVTDGVVTPALAIEGWVNPYSTASPAPLAASYNAALKMANSSFIGTDSTTIPAGDPANVAYPQGTGFTTVNVSAAGAVTWVGKMADGAAPVTYATTMGPGGQIPVHFMLYTNTGSAHGLITATADSAMPVNDGLPMLDGTISWNKNPPQATTSKDLVYKAGIPLHDLTLVGGKYVAPAAQVLGLTTARLVFTEGGLKTPTTGPSPIPGAASMANKLDLSVNLSTTNVATFTTANPAAVTLIITGKTGAITGGFLLKGDQDPTVTTTSLLNRSVKYNGLVISRKSVHQGVGYFLLAELPSVSGTTKTTVLTSQQLSGQMVLETP